MRNQRAEPSFSVIDMKQEWDLVQLGRNRVEFWGLSLEQAQDILLNTTTERPGQILWLPKSWYKTFDISFFLLLSSMAWLGSQKNVNHTSSCPCGDEDEEWMERKELKMLPYKSVLART